MDTPVMDLNNSPALLQFEKDRRGAKTATDEKDAFCHVI